MALLFSPLLPGSAQQQAAAGTTDGVASGAATAAGAFVGASIAAAVASGSATAAGAFVGADATAPVTVTHTGAFGPIPKKRRKIKRDEYGNDYLEPIAPVVETPTDRIMTAAELAEMRELLLAAERAKLEAKRKEEETLILLLMAA